MLAEVADGSKAALTAPKSDFRYTPESGLKTDIVPCPKSANFGSREPCLNRTSPKKRQWHRKAERLGGLEVEQ